MNPNLIEAGHVQLWDEDTQCPIESPYTLIIQCHSPEATREALRTGKIEFTVFGGEPKPE